MRLEAIYYPSENAKPVTFDYNIKQAYFSDQGMAVELMNGEARYFSGRYFSIRITEGDENDGKD